MSTMLNTTNTESQKPVGNATTAFQPQPSQGASRPNYWQSLVGALSLVLATLAKVDVELEQQQRKLQQSIIKDSSTIALASRSSTIENGRLAFVEGLAQGIGSIAGAFATLGTLGAGELTDPRNAQIKDIEEEQVGVKGYQDTLEKATSNPEVGENAKKTASKDASEDQVENSERSDKDVVEHEQQEDVASRDAAKDVEKNEAGSKARQDYKAEIDARLNAIKERESFKQADPSRETAYETKATEDTPSRTVSDKEMFDQLSGTDVEDLTQSLKDRMENLSNSKQKLLDQQWQRRQLVSTLGQAGGSVLSGIGTSAGASTKIDQAVAQADATLDQNSLQNMQSIEQNQAKVGDNELQAAQQAIQVMSSLATADHFQG